MNFVYHFKEKPRRLIKIVSSSQMSFDGQENIITFSPLIGQINLEEAFLSLVAVQKDLHVIIEEKASETRAFNEITASKIHINT